MIRAGIIALAVTALAAAGAPAAFAGARGCNHRTCVEVDGNGLYVNYVGASTTWNGDFTGHFHIWGGGIDTNSATGFWGYHQEYKVGVGHDLPNGAVVCAEGWEHAGGHLNSMGRACEEIEF